jgi:predicted alpha/beta-hydrolase family hydrolase
MTASGPLEQASRTELEFEAGPKAGRVPGILLRPDGARSLLVLAHGAGAGMRHPFMEGIAERLAARAVATLRYEFPYMARGGRPDPPGVATATVRAAVTEASRVAPGLPLFAGGKSFGGRMSSTAAANAALEGVRGLVFLGFPLHAAGKPGSERADHLRDVSIPLLFLQGSRDALCNLEHLGQVLKKLGSRATLHLWDGADHSFHVPKSSGLSDAQVLDEMADAIATWSARHGKPR